MQIDGMQIGRREPREDEKSATGSPAGGAEGEACGQGAEEEAGRQGAEEEAGGQGAQGRAGGQDVKGRYVGWV